jgi:hypothetical protein
LVAKYLRRTAFFWGDHFPNSASVVVVVVVGGGRMEDWEEEEYADAEGEFDAALVMLDVDVGGGA